MLTVWTSPGPHGLPLAGEAEGFVPPAGPVTILAFTLPLAGPPPNTILPEAAQSCQRATPNVGLQVELLDQDGAPVPLGAASSLQFWLRAPDGVFFPVPAALVSNGLDGLMQYVTKAGDLAQVGLWALQAQAVFGPNVLLSRWAYFAVEPNVADA